MRLRCRLGWHKWAKWRQFTRYTDIIKGGRLFKRTEHWQKCCCVCCNKERVTFIA